MKETSTIIGSDPPRFIPREQIGCDASAGQKETPARRLPPGLVPDKLL
jgi:hypothetical protein